MAAIGSLVFCTACGNLLDHPNGDEENAILICDFCFTENRDTSDKTITTKSKPNAFPSELRNKRGVTRTLTAEDYNTRATAQVTCERCGRTEVQFEEKQTRSADEGTTIYYYCECGNAWTANN